MNPFSHVKSVGLVLGTAGLMLAASLATADTQQKHVELSNIDRVELAGPGLLTIRQGGVESLDISAGSSAMERIEMDIHGTTLKLRLKDNISWGFSASTENIHYELSLKNLHQLQTSGSADVEIATDLTTNKLQFDRSGSGDIRAMTIKGTEFSLDSSGSGNFNADTINADKIELSFAGSGNLQIKTVQAKNQLEIDTAGSGDINIETLQSESLALSMSGSGDTKINQGDVKNQSVDIGGSGSYQAKRLKSDVADLDLSGSADAIVWVTEKLALDISGSSDVEYFGQPMISADTSGSSSMKSLGQKPD